MRGLGTPTPSPDSRVSRACPPCLPASTVGRKWSREGRGPERLGWRMRQLLLDSCPEGASAWPASHASCCLPALSRSRNDITAEPKAVVRSETPWFPAWVCFCPSSPPPDGAGLTTETAQRCCDCLPGPSARGGAENATPRPALSGCWPD